MKILITDLDNILCKEDGRLQEDAADFLRGAHEKMFIIILTNHPLKNTEERAANLKISQYIDLIVSATEYEMPKPDPRMINVLLALLNTEGKKFDKSGIVFVGDRPSLDIKFGNKAGIQTLRMRRGRFFSEEPEYQEEIAKVEVKNLAELASSIGTEMKKEIAKPKKDLSREFDEREAEKPAPAPKASRRRTARKPAKRRARKSEKKTGRLGILGI